MDEGSEGPPAKKAKVEDNAGGGEAKLQEMLMTALQKSDKAGGDNHNFGNLLKDALKKVQEEQAAQASSEEKKPREIPEDYPAEFVIAAVHATK